MTLNDIAEINPKTEVSHLSEDALVSFIPMSDLSDDGRWLGDDCRELRSVRHGYTAFADADVLFAKITPCMENGKGARVSGLRNGVGFGSTEYHVLRARAELDAEYLYQWTKFRELRGKAANAMTGSAGQQRVPSDFLRRYPIAEHGLEERTKIGLVLEKLDRAIEQTEALVGKQQRIKTGLMHDLLTRGLDAQGRLRDPSKSEFKPSKIGSIPVDWDPSTVGFECDQVCVGIVIRPTQYYAEQGPIALRSLNVQSGFFDLSNVVRIRDEANEKLSKSRLRAGDVVTVRTGEPGTSAVVTPELEGANCIDLVISRPGHRLRSGFLALWMNSAFGRKHVFQNQGGLAQQHFNVGDMKLVPIPIPDVTEQDAIVTRGAVITKTHDELQGTLDKLRRLKGGLMHDLLTGDVPVTPLLSAPAS